MLTLSRTLAGAAIATGIAVVGRRARTLSGSGAIAAAAVGTAAVAAGWEWGSLLIAFFVTSSALSRVGRERKDAASGAVTAKSDERDAVQVLANGGLFAVAALSSLASPSPAWAALGAGAIAAATSDTWATEIGTLAPRPPRSILSGRVVPAGTSGGVTPLGLLATVIGAAFIEVVAVGVGWPPRVAAAALGGGIAGSVADSMLGASLQARRWCDPCGVATERPVHSCGNATRPSGGISWMNNDAVNAFCTLIGGSVAMALTVRP